MECKSLFAGIEYSGALPEGNVLLVTQDSRKAGPGAIFVAVEGQTSDGHNYANKALEAGAELVVTQRPLGLAKEVSVRDTRKAFALLSRNYFKNPGKKLTLVAVTGTNGKTTVSSVLKQLLQAAGHPCGLIGTIRSEIDEAETPARFTTPEAWDLQALLARMVAAGCTHAVMEASSQALAQQRLYGLEFALGIFTNLSRDHLDYHGDMENYYAAKKSLFAQCGKMLVNTDDEWGGRLFREYRMPGKYSFGLEGALDFTARNISLAADGVSFALAAGRNAYPVRFPMPGQYSVYNALAAAGAATLLGVPQAEAAGLLTQTAGVPGRSEILYSGAFTVMRDFAHTADALEKLLSSLRPHVKGRMLVLYGCAGDRDPAKRAPMSESAVRYGDLICLTSDNPRTEPVEKIFADAEGPLRTSGKPYTVETDRVRAVRGALAAARPGDLLVLCGKGHEDYQVLDGVTVYLNEKQIVEEWLAQNPPEAAI